MTCQLFNLFQSSHSLPSHTVVNDDLVKGRAGFGAHPHRDAEIFSYVLDGRLTHADSMGNRESLGRGAVQFMSAGTGVTHAVGLCVACSDLQHDARFDLAAVDCAQQRTGC